MDFTSESNIGPGPIFKKGWLRYVSLKQDTGFIQEFFINPTFGEEQKSDSKSTKTDEFGPLSVPDPSSFFFVLKKDALFATSSRLVDISQTVDVLQITNMEIVTEGEYEGGIESLGAYKEGACFKLIERSGEQWVLCGEDAEDVQDWMKTIAVLKLRTETLQEQQGGSDSQGHTADDGECDQSFEQQIANERQQHTHADGSVDGFWKLLKDWNDCSLACGGGIQTRQRQCIPPLNGGLPCQGLAVETRPCNQEPCPDPLTEEKNEVPIVFSFDQISKRPMRYETCVIYEADVYVLRTDLDNDCKEYAPKIPGRAIMNNKTYSLFFGDNMEDIYFSVNLADIDIKDDEQKPKTCYQITDVSTKKSQVVCGKSGRFTSAEDEKADWFKEILFFKNKCHREFQKSREDDPLIHLKLMEVDKERQDEEDDEECKKKELELAVPKMGNLNSFTMVALEQECKYEKLAEQEEMLKEQQEEQEMKLKIAEEEDKQRCIEREFKKKQQELKLDVERKDSEEEFECLKNEIKSLIIQKRAQKASQLNAMRKDHARRQQMQQQKLQEIKAKMAADMLKASKLGDYSQCNPKEATESSIITYCDKNFYEDVNENMACKDPDEFCTVCCENEVGEYHAQQRKECLEECHTHNQEQEGDADEGQWVWVAKGAESPADAQQQQEQ